MSSMNSTSTTYQHIWQGRVNNLTAFTNFFGQAWFLATIIVAGRFFRMNNANDERFFIAKSPCFHKTLVVALCFLELTHAVLAFILNQTTAADLTFKSNSAVPWSMKLTFSSTTVVASVCLSYIAHVIYQMSGRKKRTFVYSMIWIVLAFAQGIGSSLFGQALEDHTLGSYITMVTLTADTLYIAVLWAMSAYDDYGHFSTRRDGSRPKILFPIVYVIYGLFLVLPPFVFLVSNGVPHVFWAFASLAGYEVIGNSFPCVIITLMCIPRFGHRNEAEDKLKSPLVKAL